MMKLKIEVFLETNGYKVEQYSTKTAHKLTNNIFQFDSLDFCAYYVSHGFHDFSLECKMVRPNHIEAYRFNCQYSAQWGLNRSFLREHYH